MSRDFLCNFLFETHLIEFKLTQIFFFDCRDGKVCTFFAVNTCVLVGITLQISLVNLALHQSGYLFILKNYNDK